MNKILVLLSILYFPNAESQVNLDKLEDDIKQNNFSQNVNDKSVGISLQGAISDGLRKNHSEMISKYSFQLNEIAYKDARDDFYLPKLNLTMALTEDHFSESLYRDRHTNAQSPKTPTGAFGLELEDYTLFNWGKDYLDFLNAKESYKRVKENLDETKRELRFQIIAEYFNLSRQNKIIQIFKKQLSHSSFIYRLAKEKLTLRKISSQDFLHAKSLFLNAHKNYQNSLYEYSKIQQSFATLLSDKLETTYRPLSVLKFKPINFAADESSRRAQKGSRDILDAQSEMKNSARSYQKVLKENLPLPKFSIKLGSYQRGFSSAGSNDHYETFTDSKNVEIVATLSMSWRLYGSGGFFNSRKTESSFYRKKISELKLKEAHREVEVANRLTHARILYLEKKFDAVSAQLKNSRKAFDKVIDNYISSKTPITNVQQILNDLLQASIVFENSKYEHLLEKLTLAKLIGIDDFPGEKFDRLEIK